MEYIKEEQILCDETLRADATDEDVKYLVATLRFKQNIRLATSIAKGYSTPWSGVIDKDDIFQEAYLGLWKACLGFDEDRGFEFSTYAVPLIKGSILRMLRDSELLKTPRWFKDMRGTLKSHGFSLPLTDEEVDILVSEGRFSREQILSYAEPEISSFDSPTVEGEDITLRDIIPGAPDVEATFSDEEIEQIVDSIIGYIKPTQRDLVEEWIYATLAGEKLTRTQLSMKYHISQSSVQRVLSAAIELIKMNREEILSMLGY